LKQSSAAHDSAPAELAVDQLFRFHHKRPVASKFTEYDPNGLLHVRFNAGGLPQA